MCFCFHFMYPPYLAVGGLAAGVASEGSGGNELTQLVTNHVLGDIDGNMLAAVVNGDGVTDEGGEDGGSSGPGLENLLFAGLVQLLNALVAAQVLRKGLS